MVLRFVVYSFALYFLMSCSSGQGENRSVTDKHVDRSTNLYATNCAACHGEDGKLKAGGASDLSKGTMCYTRQALVLAGRHGATRTKTCAWP